MAVEMFHPAPTWPGAFDMNFQILLAWLAICILKRTKVDYGGKPIDPLMKFLYFPAVAFSYAKHCLEDCQQ
jgi:hypothetical protein